MDKLEGSTVGDLLRVFQALRDPDAITLYVEKTSEYTCIMRLETTPEIVFEMPLTELTTLRTENAELREFKRRVEDLVKLSLNINSGEIFENFGKYKKLAYGEQGQKAVDDFLLWLAAELGITLDAEDKEGGE